MIMTRGNGAARGTHGEKPEVASARRVLIIGATRSLPHPVQQMVGASVTMSQFSRLDASLLARAEPDVVLAPLFSADFDITDLAAHLVRLGYRGALRAFTQPLPAPRVVISELRSDWPQLDFDLIILPGD